jgi:sulfate adenylyltransferase subunit 2
MQTNKTTHLQELEDEAIYIIREAYATAQKPVILFSGGKDSIVVNHLARRALHSSLRYCLPLLHIDTGFNFPQVNHFLKEAVEQGAKITRALVEDAIKDGLVVVKEGQSRNRAQSATLLRAIEQHGFDVLLGGARRDEEKARAKERVFSVRDSLGGWDPKAQRPELWNLYNTHIGPGENLRVFPLSNWTEIDVWQYIADNSIALPSLYYAKNGYRYRTVGDSTCTKPVPSCATNPQEVLVELQGTKISERGATRLDDAGLGAMETRKKEGYF